MANSLRRGLSAARFFDSTFCGTPDDFSALGLRYNKRTGNTFYGSILGRALITPEYDEVASIQFLDDSGKAVSKIDFTLKSFALQ